MNAYLERLKARTSENTGVKEPTKPTKLGSVSFVSATSATFLQIIDDDVLPDPAAEARRQRLLAMLERDREARYAVLTADDRQGPVIVAIAIRGAATAELAIERSRYDGVLLLELLEKHSNTIH